MSEERTADQILAALGDWIQPVKDELQTARQDAERLRQRLEANIKASGEALAARDIQNAALQSEVSRLTAIAGYAKHSSGCLTAVDCGGPCSCGLNNALRERDEARQQKERG